MKKQVKEKKEITPSVEKKEEKLDGKVFTDQIIERSRLKDFIEVNIIDVPVYKYEYLDWSNAEKNNLVGLKKFIRVEEFRVSCSVTRDQIQSLKKDCNIDLMTMIGDVLVNETATSMSKFMMATVEKIAQENYLNDYTLGDTFKAWAYNYLNKFRFKKNALGKRIRVEYQKKIKIDNIKDLMKAILAESNRIGLESKLGYGNFFVVCSVKTGLALQMHSEYTMAPIPGDGTFSPTYGMPYSIGKIAGMTIYVDPYMLFQDTNVYIGCKTPFKYPGIKIFFFADGITNEMVVKGIGAPKMILKVRYALVPVGESANLLYRKIEYQDKFKLKFK